MIKSLYKDYYQKSAAFLFPAVGITRTSNIQPVQTYISWEPLIKETDRKLLCLYHNPGTEGFNVFERLLLLGNPLFEKQYDIKDNHSLYAFNFAPYHEDWDRFLEGKYSLLSPVLQKVIRGYYGEGDAYQYMHSFLNPEHFFTLYAKLLGVDEELLWSVGELTDKYDRKKENFLHYLENLEQSSTFESSHLQF